MVSNYLGTYTKSHALGMYLSNLVISSTTVPFEHLLYLPYAKE